MNDRPFVLKELNHRWITAYNETPRDFKTTQALLKATIFRSF